MEPLRGFLGACFLFLALGTELFFCGVLGALRMETFEPFEACEVAERKDDTELLLVRGFEECAERGAEGERAEER